MARGPKKVLKSSKKDEEKTGKINTSFMLISLAFIIIIASVAIGVSIGKIDNTPCAKECTKLCAGKAISSNPDIAELSTSNCNSQCLQAKCNQNVRAGKCNAHIADSCCNLFAPVGQDPDCPSFSDVYLGALASKGIDVGNAQIITSPNGYEWVFLSSIPADDLTIRATCGEITGSTERAQYFESWGFPSLSGVCRQEGGFDQFRSNVIDTKGQSRDCILTYAGMDLEGDGAGDDGFQMTSRCYSGGLGAEGFMLVQYQFI